jgi:hypothetical protein
LAFIPGIERNVDYAKGMIQGKETRFLTQLVRETQIRPKDRVAKLLGIIFVHMKEWVMAAIGSEQEENTNIKGDDGQNPSIRRPNERFVHPPGFGRVKNSAAPHGNP